MRAAPMRGQARPSRGAPGDWHVPVRVPRGAGSGFARSVLSLVGSVQPCADGACCDCSSRLPVDFVKFGEFAQATACMRAPNLLLEPPCMPPQPFVPPQRVPAACQRCTLAGFGMPSKPGP